MSAVTVLAVTVLVALPLGSASAGLTQIQLLPFLDSVRIPNGHGSARLSLDAEELNVNSVTAGFRIRHEKTQQLKLLVKAPGVPAVVVSNGDTKGKNLGAGPCAEPSPDPAGLTNFTDFASDPPSSGTAPYLGNFLPRQPLSLLSGFRPAGTWSLIVKDKKGGPSGKFQCGLIQVSTVGSPVKAVR